MASSTVEMCGATGTVQNLRQAIETAVDNSLTLEPSIDDNFIAKEGEYIPFLKKFAGPNMFKQSKSNVEEEEDKLEFVVKSKANIIDLNEKKPSKNNDQSVLVQSDGGPVEESCGQRKQLDEVVETISQQHKRRARKARTMSTFSNMFSSSVLPVTVNAEVTGKPDTTLTQPAQLSDSFDDSYYTPKPESNVDHDEGENAVLSPFTSDLLTLRKRRQEYRRQRAQLNSTNNLDHSETGVRTTASNFRTKFDFVPLTTGEGSQPTKAVPLDEGTQCTTIQCHNNTRRSKKTVHKLLESQVNSEMNGADKKILSAGSSMGKPFIPILTNRSPFWGFEPTRFYQVEVPKSTETKQAETNDEDEWCENETNKQPKPVTFEHPKHRSGTLLRQSKVEETVSRPNFHQCTQQFHPSRPMPQQTVAPICHYYDPAKQTFCPFYAQNPVPTLSRPTAIPFNPHHHLNHYHYRDNHVAGEPFPYWNNTTSECVSDNNANQIGIYTNPPPMPNVSGLNSGSCCLAPTAASTAYNTGTSVSCCACSTQNSSSSNLSYPRKSLIQKNVLNNLVHSMQNVQFESKPRHKMSQQRLLDDKQMQNEDYYNYDNEQVDKDEKVEEVIKIDNSNNKLTISTPVGL